MRYFISLLQFLLLCVLFTAAAADDIPVHSQYCSLAAASCQPFFCGTIPPDGQIVYTRPAERDTLLANRLGPWQASARDLLASLDEEHVADWLDSQELAVALQDPAVSAHPVVQQLVAQLESASSPRNYDRESDLATSVGRRLDQDLADSDRRFREFHGLPSSDGLDGLDSLLTGALELVGEALMDQAFQPRPNEPALRAHAATTIRQQARERQQQLLERVFLDHRSEFAANLAPHDMAWSLLSTAAGEPLLCGELTGDQPLHQLIVRMQNERAQRCLTVVIPTWQPGDRLLIPDVMSAAERLGARITICVYTQDACIAPLELKVAPSQRLQVRPLVATRTWRYRSSHEVLAQLVGRTAHTVTLRRSDNGRRVSVPIGRLSREDRQHLRTAPESLGEEPARRWQATTEKQAQGMLSAVPTATQIVLQQSTGESLTVPVNALNPAEKRYLQTLNAAW